jgi:hypothetical protein
MGADSPTQPQGEQSMSTPIPTRPADPTPADPTPPAIDDPTDPGAAPPETSANREAAARRVQLRQAEAERDALAASVTPLRQQAAEGLLTTDPSLPKLHNATDLWEIGGVDVNGLTTDAGAIDPAKLKEALTALQAARPYLFQESGGGLLHRILSGSMPGGPAPASLENALGSAIQDQALGR